MAHMADTDLMETISSYSFARVQFWVCSSGSSKGETIPNEAARDDRNPKLHRHRTFR